ncbi:MAG: band 7 protein [Deltaproteobacteria bacterium]|nr:MAG: band 7 protein [Deltaproteobacteria bacterium]
MAEISRLLWFRHLRAEPTSHILWFKGGRLMRQGPGLAFWFLPLGASISEVPVDDRELHLALRGRTRDFQEVRVHGELTWRVVEPELLARRVDFSLDTATGRHREEPLTRVGEQLSQLAHQLVEPLLAGRTLRELLEAGCGPVRQALAEGLAADGGVEDLGVQLAGVRVTSVVPSSELEKALGQPARERIQQQADEATFARRALAVEKERAIQENELQNRIELATREEKLIAQQGENARRTARDRAEAEAIAATARAERTRIEAVAEAERIGAVQGAEVTAEQNRIAIYRDLAGPVLLGLAARELAQNLERIDHLSLGPDMLGPLLTRLVEAGTHRLEEG